MDKIVFHGDQEDISFYVLDSTKLAGRSLSGADEKELVYEMVEDDELLDHLASIFGEQTEDVDIEF